MAEHSPLPWTAFETDEGSMVATTHIEVKSADDKVVCDDEPYYPMAISKEDAKIIAKAVTFHVEMLDMCREHESIFRSIGLKVEADIAEELIERIAARPDIVKVEKSVDW